MQGKKNAIAIAGIHTGIGKTIVSAVVAEAMGAHYWKPVQAGIEEQDSTLLRQLLTNGIHRVHDEAVVLSHPMSPHAAAVIEGVEIDFTKFNWPQTDNTLIVETAGGLLSPIAAAATMADFITHYQLPAILVSQNYLGSINHTLLTIEVLKARGIKLLGIVMNAAENPASESFIEAYGNAPIIARIPHFDTLDNPSIAACAADIKNSLLQHLSYGNY